MSETLDEELLAERAAAVVRHLDRVAEHLPVDPDDVHGYGQLDLRRVHAVAAAGPGDLRAFLTHLRDAARR